MHIVTSIPSYRPILIGIGGNSGAGKSTLAHAIQQTLPAGTPIISGDDMHRWQRGDPHWLETTHLNPSANDLEEDARHLVALRNGQTVYRRHYDHSTGRFTEPLPITPTQFMIYEGLHPFYLAKMRNLFDVKIFLQPEETLENHRKIIRDREKRGYTPEKVMEQILRRMPDRRSYIDIQAHHADIMVESYCISPIRELGNSAETPAIHTKITLPFTPDGKQTWDADNDGTTTVCQLTHEVLNDFPATPNSLIRRALAG